MLINIRIAKLIVEYFYYRLLYTMRKNEQLVYTIS